jgi:GT2 family glycosyltransferase
MSTIKSINILIPTYNRLEALGITLTSLYYQSEKDFDVIIADQSLNDDLEKDNSIQTIIRLFQVQGNHVTILKNLPRRGMAQQRQFLLDRSEAPHSVFLDDDVILEPYVIKNMLQVLQKYNCGFTGCAVIGLSYRNDWRSHQHDIEFWENGVAPEYIIPGSTEWERYVLHNAANIYHVQDKFKINPDIPVAYKVAWVGGCVMYDTEKLREAGGFTFWETLPESHCGEDVLAQLRVMKKYGGCGVLPSGVYHQELETTVLDRKINAPEYLEI